MAIDTNFDSNGSANAGSPQNNQAVPANAGQAANNGGQNWEAAAKQALTEKSELEKVLGTQGNELGEYREYINNLKPLLDELQSKPEIVDAIMEGKLSSELAKAILEDKVTLKEATQATQKVAQAHQAVVKDLGKESKTVDPAEIERLVAEKVGLIKSEVLDEVKEQQNDKEFELNTMNFISKTEDFDKYADDIVKFLDEHKDQTDIEVAYHAVKGQKASGETAADQDRKRAEEAKRLAMNAAGGQGTFTGVQNDPALVDQLIAGNTRSRFS